MATAPASRRLNLTRDQLAAFLTDQQQIRQFELLFSTVDTLQVIVGTDFEFQADNAAATANEALAQINALAQVVDLNGQAEALSYLAEISKRIQALESAPPFSAPPAVTPASPTTSVQFNNSGAFGGSANFTYVTGTNTFTVGPAGATTTIQTLAPTGATVAGTLRLLGRNASATNGNGGGFTFTTGNALGTGTGGGVTFNTGSGRSGGNLGFTAANGTVFGGNVTFNSGNGDGPTGVGGSFVLTAGLGSTTASGGNFDMTAGAAASSGAGGNFTMLAGASVSGVGGEVTIASGFGVPNGSIYLSADSGTVIQITQDATPNLQLGFFGVTPVVKPAPTASGTTAVLASLVTSLNSLGLVDSASLTNSAVFKPTVISTASVTSPLVWDSSACDQYALTALANALTINADANTSPADGQKMTFRIKDNGTARALTWTTGTAKSFRVIGTTLPTTTVVNKIVYVGCIYNAADSRWDVVAVGQEV